VATDIENVIYTLYLLTFKMFQHRGVTLLVCASYCFSSYVSGTTVQFDPLFNGSYIARQSHVVDLNVSVSYALTRVGIHPFVAVNVSVPFVDSRSRVGTHPICPSVYLIDFVDPLGGDLRALTFVASSDELGQARSPCAVLNFTYDFTQFTYPDASPPGDQYEKVRDDWNVRFDDGRALYSTVEPFNLTQISQTCGVVTNMSSDGVEFHWKLNVCQAGSYGAQCKSDFGEYAAVCIKNEAVAYDSATTLSVASITSTEPSPAYGSIQFASFDVTSGGCQTDEVRAVLSFAIVIVSSQQVVSARYIDAPSTSLEIVNTTGLIELQEGSYLHNRTTLSPTRNTWTLSIVTQCLPRSRTVFTDYFVSSALVAEFNFDFLMDDERLVSMQIIIAADVFAIDFAGPIATAKRSWPWAIPTGMTATIFSTFASAIFA
jgi:hypothetical protein